MTPSERIAAQNAEHERRQVEADRGDRQPESLRDDFPVPVPAPKRPEEG